MEDDGFRNPSLTVDAISLRGKSDDTELLLLRRGAEPWKGRLAFPGGFVEYGEEPEVAVLRELLEETGVVGTGPELFAVRGDPDRDPRRHIVSIFYLVDVDESAVPIAGDDASEAEWVKIKEITAENVAGDHIKVIEQLRK